LQLTEYIALVLHLVMTIVRSHLPISFEGPNIGKP
jgi:hypothetical protein